MSGPRPDANKNLRLHPALYVIAASLFFTHEVDAGYREEWVMFGLPGGASVFLLLHLPMFAYFVWGYGELSTGRRFGVWASVLLAAAGVLADALHTVLSLQGNTAFEAPLPVAILAACGVAGMLQLFLAARSLRH